MPVFRIQTKDGVIVKIEATTRHEALEKFSVDYPPDNVERLKNKYYETKTFSQYEDRITRK